MNNYMTYQFTDLCPLWVELPIYIWQTGLGAMKSMLFGRPVSVDSRTIVSKVIQSLLKMTYRFKLTHNYAQCPHINYGPH